MKKEVSLKQIEANRKNAKKSTGPKTAKGKLAVRQNALVHGALATVVIQDGDGRENPEEFQELLGGLITDYQPVGTMENILVQEIATYIWRLGRVRRAEVGEIRKRADNAKLNGAFSIAADVHAAMQSSFVGDPHAALMQSAYGVNQLIILLETTMAITRDNGYLSNTNIENLRRYFGDSWDSIVRKCTFYSGVTKGSIKDPSLRENLTPEESKKRQLEALKAEIARLSVIKDALYQREVRTNEAELLSSSVPAERELLKLTRYETTLTNQLHRTISILRKQQSYRLGQPVPEININI